MKRSTRRITVYTVVEVWRGMAAGARNFRRIGNAQKYMRKVRRRTNPYEYDVQLFEGKISPAT